MDKEYKLQSFDKLYGTPNKFGCVGTSSVKLIRNELLF